MMKSMVAENGVTFKELEKNIFAWVCQEEADGVYVKLQGKDRKKSGQDKAEIKVGIAYDGWKKAGKDRYELPDKVVAAGFASAKEFHAYREAAIAEKYNLDEVSQRILASWIKKVKDKSTCF